MAPRPHKVADLARAVRAAIAGLPVKTLEVDRFGKITVEMIVPADGGSATCQNGENEWQERMRKLGLDP